MFARRPGSLARGSVGTTLRPPDLADVIESALMRIAEDFVGFDEETIPLQASRKWERRHLRRDDIGVRMVQLD
jgi:hypothetical protein